MKKDPSIEAYHIIFGQSFPRRELIKLAVIALIIIAAVSTTAFLIYKDWRETIDAKTEKLEATEIQRVEIKKEAKEELTPIMAFFETYLAQTKMDSVQTIRARGTYKIGDLELDLTLIGKNPNLYRQTLKYEKTTIDFGFDGDEAWLHQSQKVIDTSDEGLMVFNQNLGILETTIPCLGWDYGPNELLPHLQLMPDTVWNGIDCILIKNTGLIDDTAVYHYIDKNTGFEHYRRASLNASGNSYKDAEIFFQPPLDDVEYPIPGGIVFHLDGRLYYTVTFDKVSVNAGIANFLFEQPDLTSSF
ncbi:MAG: hypothetical protein ACSHYA_02165 [Opitutaceae bacterium]